MKVHLSSARQQTGPYSLDQINRAIADGRIRGGHKVMMQGVGGGFTWGAVLAQM